VRPPVGRHPLHPGIFDPQLLVEEGEFVVQSVDLGPEAGPATPLVRGSGQHGREGIVAEGQDAEDRGLGRAVPAAGTGILRCIRASEGFPMNRESRRS
jgi:hypothetical protein